MKKFFPDTPIHFTFLLLATFGIVGCSPSFQGIRFRAQRPSIDEAYRKITLALTVDGFAIANAEPGRYSAETAWRELKEKEKSESDRGLLPAQGPLEGRIELRLEKRGMLYDVYFSPLLRFGGPAGNVMPAGIRHPFREKWEKGLNALLEKEAKEED